METVHSKHIASVNVSSDHVPLLVKIIIGFIIYLFPTRFLVNDSYIQI